MSVYIGGKPMSKRLSAMPTDATIDIDSRMFNDVYFKSLWEIHNYEVYWGGAGSGKSTDIGMKLALQMSVYPGRNLVCIRKQKTDCTKSCWGEIYNALQKFGLSMFWDIRTNPEYKMTNRVNGNEIIFEGLDNIEDIKSIKFTKKNADTPGDANITDIWYEEVNAENNPENIEQLDIRLRDPVIKGRLILSFNPVSRSHFLFDLITKNYTMPGVDALILHTTYKDNKFLKKETADKYERYKFTNRYLYQVYTLGNWGSIGDTIFNSAKIGDRIIALEKKYRTEPIVTGNFNYDKDSKKLPIPESFKFANNSNGIIKIYKEPEYRHPYVFALDTAGDGSDYFAGHVCDNITGEQVAVLHGTGNPDRCVWQSYGLACYYNHALFCPESNFDSWPIKSFQLLNYPNMYKRRSSLDSTHIRNEDKYGFRTGRDNRTAMLSELIVWAEDYIDLINDMETLNEMLTFTRQEKKLKGLWIGAEPGEHDDLVMSLAILLQARSQQSMEMVVDLGKIEGEWLYDELMDAVDEGRIDRYQAQVYIKSHGCRDMSSIKANKGESRYAH